MDIQNLIKLAHQADLEGNYRVADKLTQRAIREAFFGRRRPGTSFGGGMPSGFGGGTSGAPGASSFGGGRSGGGFFGGDHMDATMHQDNRGGHSGGGAGGPAGPINTGGGNTGGGGAGGNAKGGNSKNTSKGGGTRTVDPVLESARKKQKEGTPLTEEEQKRVNKADKDAERSRNYRAEQRAKGGDGNAGGGGRGGDLNSGGQTVDTSGGSSSAGGGSNNQQTNNARFKTRDIGGDVVGMGTMGSVALATVPTAIVAALGAYGYTMLNGRVVDQKTGQPVPPQNLPPQVKNLMSGGAKANQLALRTQANQMGNAQAAQSFIEDRRANPAFKTAQDFYNDAKNKGYNQSMINQITALAKAEGYPDLSPYSN